MRLDRDHRLFRQRWNRENRQCGRCRVAATTAVEIVVCDDDIADIDADTKQQWLDVCVGVACGNGLPLPDGTQYRRYGTGDLRHDGVARRAEDAAMVRGNHRIDDLATGMKAGQRAGFTFAH